MKSSNHGRGEGDGEEGGGGRVFLKQDSRDDEEEKRHKTREDKGLLKDKSLQQLHNQK